MGEIKKIPDKDLPDFIEIVANAYPGMKIITSDDKERVRKRILRRNTDPRVHSFGFYDGGMLVGGIRLHDMVMNLRGKKIKAGGGAMLAVDLLRKKEKICRELMRFFLDYYYRQDALMAVLWPFRPDFYHKMGFGYGAKMYQYRVKPESLPRGESKKHIRFLGHADIPGWLQCYRRLFLKRTGLIEKTETELALMLELSPAQKVVGYEKNGRIGGYLIFNFVSRCPDNFILNDLHVTEVVYDSPEVLSELLTFLNSQADQFASVIIDSPDDNLHFLFHDPRNGSDRLIPSIYHESNTAGVGPMYRALNPPAIFKALRGYNFGGQNCRLGLQISDTFFPPGETDLKLHFKSGNVHRAEKAAAATLSLDMADFSSLLIGSVDFKSLYDFNRAHLSRAGLIDTVDRIFSSKEKPLCLTHF